MIQYFLVFILIANTSWACRSAGFGIQEHRYVVKSYDFEVKGGQFFSRPKGLTKTALVLNPRLKPLKWISKYTSVTFSQIGPDFPFGGINEQGLTVEALWLSKTEAPNANGNSAVNESQLIQYLLDSAQSVDEAFRLASQIQIEKTIAPIHYFLCDQEEKCGVIQLTNDGLKMEKVFNPDQQVIENIVHAEMVKPEVKNEIRDLFLSHRKSTVPSVASSFQWLEKVKTVGWSKWQIVYDVKKREVHFQYLNEKGQPGSRWTVKVKNPGTNEKKIAFTADGVATWNKKLLDNNLRSFSVIFPQLETIIPILEKYLEKSY